MSTTSFKFEVITDQASQLVKFHCWKGATGWADSQIHWGHNNHVSPVNHPHDGVYGNSMTLHQYTYPNAGTYTIDIEPGVDGFRFDVTSTDVSITIGKIKQWGSNEWACFSDRVISSGPHSDFKFTNQSELDVNATDRPYFRAMTTLSGTQSASQKKWEEGQIGWSGYWDWEGWKGFLGIINPFEGCTNLVGTYSMNDLKFNLTHQTDGFINHSNTKFRSPIDNWKFTQFSSRSLPHIPIPLLGVTSSISVGNTILPGQNTEYFRAGLNISNWFLAGAWIDDISPTGYQNFFNNGSINDNGVDHRFKFNTFAQPRFIRGNGRSDQSINSSLNWGGTPGTSTDMPQWRVYTDPNSIGIGSGDNLNQQSPGNYATFSDCPGTWCNEPYYMIIDTFYAGPTVSGDSMDVGRQNFPNTSQPQSRSIHEGHKFYIVKHTDRLLEVNNSGSTFSGYQRKVSDLNDFNATSSYSYGKYFINPNLVKDHIERRVVSIWGPTNSVFALYAEGPTSSITERFGLSQTDLVHIDKMITDPNKFDILRRKAADVNFSGTVSITDKYLISQIIQTNGLFPGTDGQYVLYPATFSIGELPVETVSPYDNRQRPYLKVGIRGLGSVTPDIERVNQCGGSYTWSRNSVSYSTTTQSYHTDGTFSTWYLDLTVTQPPTLSISGPTEVCVNSNITLNGSPNPGVWSSSDDTVATVNRTSGEVTGVSTGTATITYTVQGTGGCSGNTYTYTHNITVNPLPSAGTLSGNQNLCVGSTDTYSSTETGGDWNSDNTQVATVGPTSGEVTGVSTGTATITYTVQGTGGCSNVTATRTVTVTAPPSAGTLSGNQNLCVGSTDTYSSTETGGDWNSDNTQVATVDPTTGLVTGIAAGISTITYTVQGTGGCPNATSTRIVTVTTPPSAGTLSGTQMVCIGNITIFTSSSPGGTWVSNDLSVASVDSASGEVTGVSTGTATITYTVQGTGGCSNVTATRTVTVTAPPSAGTLSGNQNLCVDSTDTYSSTVTGGVWSSSNVTVATVNSTTGLVTGIDAGISTITYTVQGTGGCPNATNTLIVTVTQPAQQGNISPTSLTFSCYGATHSFIITPQDQRGIWVSTDNTIVGIDPTTGLATSRNQGTCLIKYVVTPGGGCPIWEGTSSVTVLSPISAGTITGPDTFCIPGSGSFTSDGTSGGIWSSNDTNIISINQSGQATSANVGSAQIIYTVQGQGGCPDATSIFPVIVTAAPSAGNLSGNQILCVGSTDTYSSTVTGGEWSSSDTSVATVDSITGLVTTLSSGVSDIIYTVSGSGGCSSATASILLSVSAHINAGPISGNRYLCVGGTETYTSNAQGGVWASGNTSIATVNPSTGQVSGQSIGTTFITYTISAQGGCPSSTATIDIYVTAPPIAGTLSGTQDVCVNSTTLFSSTLAGGYWSSADTSIARVGRQTGLVTGLSAGTTTISYTVIGTGGCPVSVSTRGVTVSSLNTSGTIQNLPSSACVGHVVTLSSSPSGGQWSSSNPSIVTIDQSSGQLETLSEGSCDILYSLSQNNVCPPSVTRRTINVISLPTLGLSISTQSPFEITSSITMCVGRNHQISVIRTNDTSTRYSRTNWGTFQIFSGGTGIIDLLPGGYISARGQGQVTVRYTIPGSRFGSSCSNLFLDLEVNVVTNLPHVTISGSQSICVNSPTTRTYTSTFSGNWSTSDPNSARITTTPTNTDTLDIEFSLPNLNSQQTINLFCDRTNECGVTRTTYPIQITTGRLFTTTAGPIPSGGSYRWTRHNGTLIQTITSPGNYTHTDSNCDTYSLIITFLPACQCWQLENISQEQTGYYIIYDESCYRMRPGFNPSTIQTYDPLNYPYQPWNTTGQALLPGEIINFCAPTFSILQGSENIIISNTDKISLCVNPISPLLGRGGSSTNLDQSCFPAECQCNCISMTYSDHTISDLPTALLRTPCFGGDCPESVRQHNYNLPSSSQIFGWNFDLISPYILPNIANYPGVPARVDSGYLKICGSPIGKPFYEMMYDPDPSSSRGGGLYYRGNTYSIGQLPEGFTWSVSDQPCCSQGYLPPRTSTFQSPYTRLSWEGRITSNIFNYPYYPTVTTSQTVTHFQNNNCPPPSPPTQGPEPQ